MGKPLVTLEALRLGYPYASERLHRFVLDGMADVAEQVGRSRATHLAYVEREPGEGSGLIAALAARAAIIVTDDHPGSFLPRMVRAAAARLDVRVVAIDSNGLVPMRLFTPRHATAYSLRRELQRLLPPQLERLPSRAPLTELADLPAAHVDPSIRARWSFVAADELRSPALLAGLPVDREVGAVASVRGGPRAASELLARFVREKLPRYLERSDPDVDSSSGLSPYLHFGHVGVHRVLAEVAPSLDVGVLRPNAGKREGFYRLAPEVEAFLDQLVTWRELAFHGALHDPSHEQYEGLPAWARATLAAHAADPRPVRYDEATLEAGRTHDRLWNAAQRELRETGRMHNQLRMLWGKKILEWSDTPEEAFRIVVRLNDRYAFDGRDPNSYANIAWVFGRYDRPWGPERPIFGTVRYMSSANQTRKLALDAYLARFGDDGPLFGAR